MENRIDERRFLAAALGFAAALLAVPVGLAQLDFGQLVNVFHIDSGDAPHALVVFAAVSGVGTLVVSPVAGIGAALALVDPRAGGRVLAGAALSGIVTATILWWIPGLLLGAATAAARRAAGRPLLGGAQSART